MALLEAEDVYKSYATEEMLGFAIGAKVPALNGVSLTLEAGQTIGLTGESGSGKTTLARVLTGSDKPEAGRVTFGGQNVGKLSAGDLKKVRRVLRLISEDTTVGNGSDASVSEVLYSAIDSTGAPRDLRGYADELFKRVGLQEEMMPRRINQISGGQRQRLLIARALSLKPQIVVADEPVSNLDLDNRTVILRLFKNLQRQIGFGLIFISHSLAQVRYMTQDEGARIGTMFAGRIVEIGSGRDFFSAAVHPYSKSLIASNPNLSPLPGQAFDLPGDEYRAWEMVDEVNAAETMEGVLSMRGQNALAASKARQPGCPYDDWCPERFERCPQETPRLLPVIARPDRSPLPPAAQNPAHTAACFHYMNQ